MAWTSGHSASRVYGLATSSLMPQLRDKFLKNPRWGVMFTLGRFRFVSATWCSFHRSRMDRRLQSTPSLRLLTSILRWQHERDASRRHQSLPRDSAQITSSPTPPSATGPPTRACDFSTPTAPTPSVSAQGDPAAYTSTSRSDARPFGRSLVTRFSISWRRRHGAPAGQIAGAIVVSFVGDATSRRADQSDQGFHYDLHDYRSIAFFFH